MRVRKTKSERTEEQGKQSPSFTKQQMLASGRYRERKDLLQALLEDGKCYCFDEVDEMVEKYKKGQVK